MACHGLQSVRRVSRERKGNGRRLRAWGSWTHKLNLCAYSCLFLSPVTLVRRPSLLPLFRPPSMSSLNNLLNPESSYESSLRLQAVRSPSSATTSPTEQTSESSSTAVELRPPPPRAEVVIRAHEPHPDCPDTLACLPDTDGRPQHTLPVILRCTILGSPRKRLTIREIYAAMERKYPYYKTAGPAWKQSVRHHLSLNRLFERQPRPPSDPGFGSYWTVNLEAPPGTKRPRKRGGRSNKPEGTENGPTPGLGPVLPTVIIPMQGHPPTISTMAGPPVPQPPLSATPSTTSTFISTPNGLSASSSTASSGVRPPPPSHIPYAPPDHHLAHHESPHNAPQHMYSQSHPPPPLHPHEHPHMHVQSPHPQSQPPSHPHMPPPSHMHQQPPPHPHSHAHPHSVPPPHPHAMPPSHSHTQPPPIPYGHSPPPGHPHSQPPPPPPHSHLHSQPPPQPHPNSHYPHQQSHHPSHPSSLPPSHPPSHSAPPPPPPPSSVGPNSHPQASVSTIAKLRPVDSRSFSQTSTMRSRRLYDDDDDDEMDWEDGDGPQYSDDDYSSSEDMPYQYDPRAHHRNSNSYSGARRRAYSGSQGQTGKSVLHGAFSGYSTIDHPDSTIERLKMEMAGLRRQSQDAVNASLRLSDQLTASQEDAARAKSALKVAENMLEEEARRRLQAEKNAEEEVRRRRVAEETLRQYEVQTRGQRNPNAYPRS